MPDELQLKETYPNAPLIEAVFEIRFSGEPRIECNRDLFFEKVREEFPCVLVPQAKDGRFIALDPHRFEKADGSAGFMIAMDKFALYVRRYPGFKTFSEMILKWFSIFHEIYRIDSLKRTGLRYINLIPFSRESGLIPLHHLLNLGIQLPNEMVNRFENLSLTFTTRTTGGIITTKVESILSPDQSQEALLLDFDYAKVGELEFQDVGKYLRESHSKTKKFFEDLLADKYLEFIKGETI
ncbi:MAG: TIGR04255 family protein [bacterium]|nr:TIGR04255 family protein [bacterium]